MMHQVTDATAWNTLVKRMMHASFLQSWEWGEFQRAVRRGVMRYANDDQNIVAQVIVEKLAHGITRWYVPRGPVGDPDRSVSFLEELTVAAKNEDVTVLHVDPLYPIALSSDAMHPNRQPEATEIVDLSGGFDSVLSRMKPKTRYNIRVAEKHGVTVESGTSPALLKEFLMLSAQTAKRQHIRLHPDTYYNTMLRLLGPMGMCEIVITRYRDAARAALFLIKFGDTVTYLHGASSSEDRNVMAPYSAHAFAMQNAQRDGFHYYDLWGVAPQSASDDHPYHHITRFKQGFGGTYVEYPRAIVRNLSTFKFLAYNTYRKLRS